MAVITSIDKQCDFFNNVSPGDTLVSVNDIKITDVFDLMYNFDTDFFSSPSGKPIRKKITITVIHDGVEKTFTGRSALGSLGFEFDSFLMDERRSCKNKCCFCFIDQMPKGMRKSLYYKDDDYRLSVIYGNYVTLTNVTDEDISRIISLHLSPLNISVHTTDPDLRVQMMKNPNAALIGEQLDALYRGGIRIKAQVVVCKGINDGSALEKTLKDLKKYCPQLSSVSIVPAGLTKYRDGLVKLSLFDSVDALNIINLVSEMAEDCYREFGTRIFYVADEYYLKAGLPLPESDYYEEFEQLENGVGMLAEFRDDIKYVVNNIETDETPYNFSIATGEAAAPFFKTVVIPLLQTKLTNLHCNVITVKNDFFGDSINVAGLLTGTDIMKQAVGSDFGDFLVISDVMLRDAAFLDDVTVDNLQEKLHTEIRIGGQSAEDLYKAITQKEFE